MKRRTGRRVGLLARAALASVAAWGCAAEPDPRPVVSGEASFTTYTSYAACCPENPNYDPLADTTECTEYSACSYSGDFAVIGHQSYDWVRTHNLVAFYDDRDPGGGSFAEHYGGRMIRLTQGGVTFDALIADTCGNADCDGCCSENSRPSGILIDVEEWTARNNLGGVDAVDGTVRFEILETRGTYPGCTEDCGTVDPVY